MNACGGNRTASFVYCNFNKHLKFSPHMFRQWLRILQAVEGSVLCLLENPYESIPYMTQFIRRVDESLLDRVRWQRKYSVCVCWSNFVYVCTYICIAYVCSSILYKGVSALLDWS